MAYAGEDHGETEAVGGENCTFRTTQDQTVWPVEIESVRLSGLPLAAPANPRAAGAVSVLRIGLKCASAEAAFTTLGVDRLRFFLRAASNISLPLYELLCRNVVGVALAEGPNDPEPVTVRFADVIDVRTGATRGFWIFTGVGIAAVAGFAVWGFVHVHNLDQQHQLPTVP